MVSHITDPNKNIHPAGCQWLTPVILTTQEAGIRRIARQIVYETLSGKTPTQKKALEGLKV
jgi:hypothetical protein